MRADELKYSARQICSACRGELIRGDAETVFSGVSTDSREIRNGDLFVPLRGDNFNGFDYVIPALRAGAGGSLLDNDFLHELPNDLSNHVLIRVQDTLRSLTDLASTHRKLFPVPLIAVTGSSGKTTVKEMIASILSVSNRTLATKGNLNNLIGLPMTILSISPQYTAAVVEAGINHTGEMELLARAASPDVSVISTIGPVHLEGLKDLATVAREKFRLIEAASTAGVIPCGIPELEALHGLYKGRLLTFGTDRGDFRASNITSDDRSRFNMECPWGTLEVSIQIPGRHNIENALAASASCLLLGSSMEDVAKGLENLQAPSWRMETVRLDKGRVLLKDYYNANPQSMKAALETLVEFDQRSRKIAILGDMMELGEQSSRLHHEIGRLAASLKIDRIIFIGEFANDFGSGFLNGNGSSQALTVFSDKEAAWEAIKMELGAYDRILVKASRSMKMELIANRILEEI